MKYQYHLDGLLPKNNEVFVFGSNLAGRHGKGAALVAAQQFGAKYGVGVAYMNGGYDGYQRHCYAIPTKGYNLEVLSISQIKNHVDFFLNFVKANPQDIFYITRIGCGLAGYQDAEIAPLFKGCGQNVSLPINWKPFLESNDD